MIEIQPVYSSVEVLKMTGEYTQEVLDKNIQGDLIECGVAAGSQIAMMQQTLIKNQKIRQIWGFDSFEGIPYATEKDTTQPAIGEIDQNKLGLLETTGVSAHSLESVLQNFERYELPVDNLNLVKGWFEETIEPHSKQIDKIALLRLDGDLYRSTYVCLKHLFKKVVKGGIIIIDDYQLVGCREACHEFMKPNKIEVINRIGIYKK